MNSQLKLLRANSPDWVVAKSHKACLRIVAQVELPSGRLDAPLRLVARVVGATVSVGEEEPRRWPRGCPERHINRDGSFCLGVGDPIAPKTASEAQHWWSWLREFIHCQRVAELEGIWPDTRTLHHGDAYKHQLRMEELSAGTLFESDVQIALQTGVGWLAGELPRLAKGAKRLVNLRAPCPRGCMYRQASASETRKRHPKLRRSCAHKELIYELIREERQRRAQEAQFWKSFQNHRCCDTMRNCPLRREL